MRNITPEELKTILDKHAKWLRDEEGGERADLSWSNLSWSNLSGSNLSGSDLSGSDLSWSNLSGSDLSGSNLSDCNFSDCNFSGCNFSGCKLSGNVTPIVDAMTRIVPEGSIIGYKKAHSANGDVIVKLRIPEEARRSNATGRKCRAEWAEVIDVIGAEEAWSSHAPKTYYRKGETVRPDKWDETRWDECSNGIHFFITQAEAEAYSL